MKKYDYLIIGGGIAGVTAAETIRGEDSRATIGVISDEPHVLYSRVSLPTYLKKKIPREKLFLRSADDFTKKRIDVLLQERVTHIDMRYREVGLANRQSAAYTKLLIASGGSTRQWDQGIDERMVYRLQTIDDADRLYKALDEKHVQAPTVVGGSFIALEFLDIFAAWGLRPNLLVREPYFFAGFIDEQGGALLRANFEAHGVAVHYGASIAQAVPRGEAYEVGTTAMQKFTSDAFAVGIGVSRNMACVQGSGIAQGEQGVKVNEFLETDQEGVFAAGDIAEFYDVIAGEQRIIGNWTNAFLQGKRAGLNMVGKREAFKNVASYSIANLGFQITAVGQCSNTFDAVTRIDTLQKQYERFFMRDGIVVGAFLINRFQDKAPLAKLIENRTHVDAYREQLGTFGFDIQNIPL